MSFSAPFLAWLAQKNATRVLLAEVAVKSGGVEITRYLSTLGYTSGAVDTPANTVYSGRISGGVQFTRKLDLSGAGGSVAFGDIELDNSDGALDAWLTDIWARRTISLYLGDARWARSAFEKVFSGTVEDIGPKGRAGLSLRLSDVLAPLNGPISTTAVGGTADNKNALLPIALGEVFNVEPVLLDAATQKYAVHLGACEQIVEVRDNGVPVAITATAGSGYFTLTNARYGQITADVQGAKIAGSYRNDAGGLIEWVATTLGDGNMLATANVDAAALATFRAACTQPVGDWLPQRANRIAVMRDLAASVGATVTTTAGGLMRVVRLAFGASSAAVGTAQMIDGSFGPISRPDIVGAVRLNCCRNWTPQASSLAGSVTAASLPLLLDEFVQYTATDATTLTDYKQSATPEAADTLLVVESDATTEATRRLALWKTPRTVFAFDGWADLLPIELGDVITLTHPRFGLSAGAAGLVVGVTTDWAAAHVCLEVLV